MANPEDIKAKLEASLQPVQHLQITDTSNGCGSAFEVTIVSPQFEGKRLLQRHQMVNQALADLIPKMHAFSQKPLTPSEWQAASSKQ